MRITIQFLGNMARLAGGNRRNIEIPNPASVADAVQKLMADPDLAGHLGRCNYSIRGKVVGASERLCEGDELLIISPAISI
jgi:molybdopterin converting factor small subunit